MRLFRIHISLLCGLLAWKTGIGQMVSALDPPPTEVQLRIHLDSLMDFWPVASVLPEQQSPGISPELPPSEEMADQLEALGGEMQFQWTERVRHFVELYVRDRRAETEAVLGMMQVWMPDIQRELSDRKLPLQLRFLPAVLSAGNPLTTGQGGKSGLWQLPYHAALRYGLECGPILDQRRDPNFATPAALTHLGNLFKLYGEWSLAVTAYTAGPASITKARLRSSQNAGFDRIYDHLPPSHRDYWPAFVAMNYIGNHYQELGLRPLKTSWTPQIATSPVEQPVRLSGIAEILPVTQAELRAMNPQLRGDYVCLPGEKGAVCIPVTMVDQFEANKPKLYAGAIVKQEPSEPEVEESEVRENVPDNRKEVLYTIQAGDNLGSIASRHGVRVSDLQRWNGIRGTMIKAGEKLTIYVKKSTPAVKKEAETSSNKLVSKQVESTKSYTVGAGDTLWEIAQQYPGVSPEDIMELNGINESIRPGQVLKIPVYK